MFTITIIILKYNYIKRVFIYLTNFIFTNIKYNIEESTPVQCQLLFYDNCIIIYLNIRFITILWIHLVINHKFEQ